MALIAGAKNLKLTKAVDVEPSASKARPRDDRARCRIRALRRNANSGDRHNLDCWHQDLKKAEQLQCTVLKRKAEEDLGPMKTQQRAQYQISVDGVPRRYRDRQDIALQTARFLKSRNPNNTVTLKDLQTGEEIIVAFKSGQQ